MEFEGTYHLNAAPAEVWEALNSEALLTRCIPGCDSVERQEDGSFAATVTLRIGPIKARFRGEVEITEQIALTEYLIAGEGKGGVAGFAKGRAKLHLTPEGDGTWLAYEVDAQIGGKIAQLGSRMMRSTVQKLSDEFFQNLAEELGRVTS